MAEYNEYNDQYKVPVMAKLLHSLPHYNITFHRINNTFRPHDDIYLESLGILGSAPAALLIISLVGLLLYLMTRCCDRKPRPAHSITSLKVALSVVTVICCGVIGLGLYGNDDLHNGLLEVLTAGRKVDTLVTTIRNQTHILENTLKNRIRPQLVELADIFDQPVSNQSALSILFVSLNIVQGNVTLATNAASDIRRPLISITMTKFLSDGDRMELIRWPGTVATLALLLVLCAVLLVGVARHSRCALILFSVCGLLAVTGSWLMSGLYLSSSVAVGDLCINPADFLVSVSPRDLPTNVLLHYTQCEPGHTNPFTQRLRESQNSLNNARSAMAAVMKISLVLFKSSGLQPKLGAVNADLNSSERLLTQLTALVDCKAVHHNFLTAARGLCEGGLLGLVLMLIASFIAAILLTIMVWVDSHTWIYIRKRIEYAQVEEPSYISHPAPQNHQQLLNASRTLPRNHNGHFSPPVISGSNTLQHPSRRQQHEMMAHTHLHQNMRAMGTHTLGRLPSHNHSPSHMAGPNNAVYADSRNQKGISQPQHQMPSQNFYCHHPHSLSHSGDTAHQHALFHQQQYGTYSTAMHYMAAGAGQHGSIYQQIVEPLAQNGGQLVNSPPTYQTLTTESQNAIYVPNLTTLRRQTPQTNNLNPQLPLHFQPLANSQQTESNNISSQQNQQQIKSPKEAKMHNVTRLENMDSAIYSQEKGIYKCSTLRQGGRFDSKHKPSILNCPLPEIPREPRDKRELTNEPIYQKQQNYSKTLQRPPMKLPPQIRAIPPPRVGTNVPVTSVESTDSNIKASNANHYRMNAVVANKTEVTENVQALTLPLPPAVVSVANKTANSIDHNINSNAQANAHSILNANEYNSNNNNSNGAGADAGADDDDDLPPPPSPPPAINDDSNYAVTEL